MSGKISQLLTVTKRDEAHITTGPVCFHPEDCFESDFLNAGASEGTGGEEETSSMENISPETFLDIGVSAGTSGIDPQVRGTSERSFIG
jgi:hypothetical protein